MMSIRHGIFVGQGDIAADSWRPSMNFRPILLALAFGTMLAFGAAPSRAADYAPLNCAAAASAAEKAICGNYGLGQLEARMATLYQWSISFVGMGQRGDMQDGQRAFIKQRDACGADAGCLRRVYETRIAQLQAVMERVRERGPF
jgi:uncharacterized protein